ncbi:MAG: TonB-dependent receptor plug domain-containing protein, partial [Novosphingobium sp.]
MMVRFILKSSAAALALIPVSAWADDGSGNPTYGAREIIVTGHGLAQMPATPAYDVTTMEREEIVSSASGRIEDVLGNVAGFQQFRRSDSRSSNPSAQGATLRAIGGNATSRALVLLDGVPMADPFFGYIPFSALVPDQLERVRVTRGGGAGAFGAGAIAGTIELESATAETIGLVNGTFLVNDRGETEASASLAPQVGQGFAVVSGRWDRGEGFYTTPRDQRVPATSRAGYESWSVSGRLVQPIGDTVELQARALTWDDNRTLRFDGADSSSKGTDASIRLVGRGEWQFDVLGYAQWRNFTNVVISSTRFVPVLDQRDTPSTGFGGKVEIRPPVGEGHVLRLGADLRRSHGNLDEVAISAFSGNPTAFRRAGGTNTDLGFFAEHDWSVGPAVITVGGRLDRWTIRSGYYREVDNDGVLQVDNQFANRSGWEPSFRGGATVEVAKGLRMRATAYRGLRLPTLNELYRPFVVFPVVTQANAELDIEKLRGFEAGLDWTHGDSLAVSLTAFDNKVKGAIANVTLEQNLRQRRNVGSIKARG